MALMRRRLHQLLEDSSDSEEEYEYYYPRRRPRWIKERADYFDTYDDVDFVIHFRLTKESAMAILALIEHELEFFTDRNEAVSPMSQLLLTLRFYATGGDQLSLADFSGVSKSTAHRIIHRVSCAIAALRPAYIRMPNSPQAILDAQMAFYGISRFPKAIGAMDCTHVRIRSPGGDEAERFRNRKGYFSLNVQAICSAKMEFTDIVARWPGSTHDSSIFNNCNQRALFEQGAYGDSVLLVDAGYACRTYLMPPLNVTRTPQENLYNESQIRSRNVVERLFGCWKRRFPIVAVGMNVKLENTFPIIVATAVLHNILRRAGDEMPMDDPKLQLRAPWEDLLAEGEANGNQIQAGAQNQGRVRRTLIDEYFQSLIQ